MVLSAFYTVCSAKKLVLVTYLNSPLSHHCFERPAPASFTPADASTWITEQITDVILNEGIITKGQFNSSFSLSSVNSVPYKSLPEGHRRRPTSRYRFDADAKDAAAAVC